ncbi:MAG: hypothetical protein RRY22_04115 [Bacilli bacterium]
MEEIAKALFKYWNSFTIPAYVENNVPEEARLPYITYTLGKNDYLSSGLMQVRVWYKTQSFKPINAKVDEILAGIDNGVILHLKTGYINIYKGTPEVQFQPSDDQSIKIAYINLEVNYITK